MDTLAIADLRARVLAGEDVPTEEITAALAAMCSRPPPTEKAAKRTAAPATTFNAMDFLRKRAQAPSGDGTA